MGLYEEPSIAHKKQNNNLQLLEVCIWDPVAAVTHSMLEMWREFRYHLDVCCAIRVPTLIYNKVGSYQKRNFESFPS